MRRCTKGSMFYANRLFQHNVLRVRATALVGEESAINFANILTLQIAGKYLGQLASTTTYHTNLPSGHDEGPNPWKDRMGGL